MSAMITCISRRCWRGHALARSCASSLSPPHAALAALIRPRCFSSSSPPPLAPAELIDGWMANDELLSSDLGFFRRTELYFMLRTLPGLDLPEFLQGARMAYSAVTRLMYSREFEALGPLVSPAMLNAMRQTMEEEPFDVRRVEGHDEDESIVVTHATLVRAQLLTPPSDDLWLPRQCHLDVAFTSEETWRIYDYREGMALPPFDGRSRTQQSTWRFEGSVRPPPPLPDAEVDIAEATRRMQASLTRTAADVAGTREGDDPDLMGTAHMRDRGKADGGGEEDEDGDWIVYAVV
jgi:hypothetical protein